MKEDMLACDILKSMDIAVLKRLAPRTYQLVGNLPDFYYDMFCDETGQPSCEPWNLSPMLDFFLDDVESFFEEKKTGELTSDIWQEDGKTTEETGLIAKAVTYGEHQVLLIRMLRDYQERVVGLRHARSQFLKNRHLASNLEYYKKKSRIDDLTQIFNKATFMDLLENEVKRSVMLDYSLTLFIIDVDDFKQVNDTYGHLVGDAVLKTLGATLSHSLRQNDIVARFGGEEFTVLVPQVDGEQALNLANKLREKIAETVCKDIPRITVSIGCSSYTPCETIEKFIERADAALYKAKTSGKNKVCSSSLVTTMKDFDVYF
ncbi:MAG: hypothetical protein CSA21_04285 [Deltaproteobacteria bacterium]|nr:MAG: hypothetical protein CSA21_04285 [Deltaproteobacteria bacterium]